MNNIKHDLACLVSEKLGIEPSMIQPELAYHSIPQWDSLRHVSLMLALEEKYSVSIDENLTLELTRYDKLEQFIVAQVSEEATVDEAPMVDDDEEIYRGLRGVYADHTLISHIDGAAGQLYYRGYPIDDVVARLSFEETAFLLIKGWLPSTQELHTFSNLLKNARTLPDATLTLIDSLKTLDPVDVLRTCVSLLGSMDAVNSNEADGTEHVGIQLISQIPLVLGVYKAALEGRKFVMPSPSLSHTEFVMACLDLPLDDMELVKHFENDLIVHADHGSNASAFAARVAIGTEASMYAAVTSAISTFQGALHGGAAEEVMKLIDEVQNPQNAQQFVDQKWEEGKPVMGFGHRVYRKEDPRVKHLQKAASFTSDKSGNQLEMDIISSVKKAMIPYRRHGIDANVDLYAGIFYRKLGMDNNMAIPLFVVGRIVGWVAQAMEQKNNNVLIRPLLKYTGEIKTLEKMGVAA